MIAPVLEEISGDYAGKLTVAKMDVDANTATAPKYGVRGIPSLLIFNGGEVVGTKVGALSNPSSPRLLTALSKLRLMRLRTGASSLLDRSLHPLALPFGIYRP